MNFYFIFFIYEVEKRRKNTFLRIKKRTNNTSKIKAKIPTVTPTPIPIAWLLWFSDVAPKLQVIPSPEYPLLHAQLKLPIVFVQSELTSHPPLFVWHSLISIYLSLLQLIFEKRKINKIKRNQTNTRESISWISSFTCTKKTSFGVFAVCIIMASSSIY